MTGAPADPLVTDSDVGTLTDVQEGPWERARGMARALEAADAVDRNEFTTLARGWAELTAAGEVSGWAVLVRVEATDRADGDAAVVSASVLDSLLAQIPDLDVPGQLDERTIGLLLDADEPACRAMVASVVRTLDESTELARWRVVVCRTSSDDAVTAALDRLDRSAPDLGEVVAPWQVG